MTRGVPGTPTDRPLCQAVVKLIPKNRSSVAAVGAFSRASKVVVVPVAAS